MLRSKFGERSVVFMLRQVEEGTVVEEVCRKAGTYEQTHSHEFLPCRAAVPDVRTPTIKNRHCHVG